MNLNMFLGRIEGENFALILAFIQRFQAKRGADIERNTTVREREREQKKQAKAAERSSQRGTASKNCHCHKIDLTAGKLTA